MYFNGQPLPGLSISGKNTYTEWEMIPTSRLFVKPAEVKTAYVDLPGANGGLDYTELLTGEPKYGYRKGSWEFFLIPGENWANVYRSLCNYLHGKAHTVVLLGDPTIRYTGRLQVSEWQSGAHNSIITIDYVLDPEYEVIEGEDEDENEMILREAAKLLRKAGNQNRAIILQNNEAVLVSQEAMFNDGDSATF